MTKKSKVTNKSNTNFIKKNVAKTAGNLQMLGYKPSKTMHVPKKSEQLNYTDLPFQNDADLFPKKPGPILDESKSVISKSIVSNFESSFAGSIINQRCTYDTFTPQLTLISSAKKRNNCAITLLPKGAAAAFKTERRSIEGLYRVNSFYNSVERKT